MRRYIVILFTILVAVASGQTHIAEEHYSTERIRLKDKTITDITDTINASSSVNELATAKGIYDLIGSINGIGVEFEYIITQLSNTPPAAGRGYFSNDTVWIHLTDKRGIDVNDAISGATSVNIRTENSYISYNISSVNYSNDTYFVLLDLGKGVQPDPPTSGIRYLTFGKDNNTGGETNDTVPNPGLLGYEFQYTAGIQPPLYGTIYISHDTIELYEQDKRGIYINNVVPVSSHIRLRDDSIMVTYEILSSDYYTNYYRLIIALGKNSEPTPPATNEIKYISFINAAGITPTGLEQITENGHTGLARIGDNRDNKGDIGDHAIDLSYSNHTSTSLGATGDYSHAEGLNTEASGDYSHAEGLNTEASGDDSHAEGSGTIASEFASHAEGDGNISSGIASHSEGETTEASGDKSHAEGNSTIASGDKSHAEGSGTIASGDYSHAGGYETIAQNNYQTSIGKYNESTSTTTILEVGIGVDDTHKDNGLEVHTTGEVTIKEFMRLEPSSAPSVTLSQGLLYSSSSTNGLYYYNGTAWKDLTASSSGITNINDAGDIDISGITDWSVPKWSASTGKWIMDVDSTSTGLSSDYKIKLNTTDATPDYFDNKVVGSDFITITNSSGAANIKANAAAVADIHTFADVNKVVKPNQLPRIKLMSESSPLTTAGIQNSDGLRIRKYDDTEGATYELSMQTGSLPLVLGSSLNLNDYVIVNTNVDETVRITLGDLKTILNSNNLTIEVLPKLHYVLNGTSGSFASFTFDRNIQIIDGNGNIIPTTQGAITFENASNCSGATSLGSASLYGIAITVDAGTYTNDGTVYGSIDIVYTSNTSGDEIRNKLNIIQSGIER